MIPVFRTAVHPEWWMDFCIKYARPEQMVLRLFSLFKWNVLFSGEHLIRSASSWSKLRKNPVLPAGCYLDALVSKVTGSSAKSSLTWAAHVWRWNKSHFTGVFDQTRGSCTHLHGHSEHMMRFMPLVAKQLCLPRKRGISESPPSKIRGYTTVLLCLWMWVFDWNSWKLGKCRKWNCPSYFRVVVGKDYTDSVIFRGLRFLCSTEVSLLVSSSIFSVQLLSRRPHWRCCTSVDLHLFCSVLRD